MISRKVFKKIQIMLSKKAVHELPKVPNESSASSDNQTNNYARCNFPYLLILLKLHLLSIFLDFILINLPIPFNASSWKKVNHNAREDAFLIGSLVKLGMPWEHRQSTSLCRVPCWEAFVVLSSSVIDEGEHSQKSTSKVIDVEGE